MTQCHEDVLAVAESIFGASRIAEVLAALDRYGSAPHEREVHRVRLAVLRLSEGKMDKLLDWLKIAKEDYRDPLAAVELGPRSAEEGARDRAAAKRLIEGWGRDEP